MTDTTTDLEFAARARGLVKSYGTSRAVDRIDLEVRRGECLGLLGPNGAGKTTTLKMLSTLVLPTEGQMEVLGLDPVTNGPAVRRRLGVVPQEVALYGDLSARENLAFFARMYGVSAGRVTERADWGLEVSGLADRAGDRVSEFSGGMQRRLNIVAALLHEPELVFLDEPTVGIDPQSRNHIFEMVERLHADGLTLVYTTHQLGEVERLCQRIVIMDRGRILASGTLEELQQGTTPEGAGALDLPADVDLERVVEVLRAAGIKAAVRAPALGLEEIFLALTGRELRDED
ncbi:MAG: ABC transporter ATP-binding protein [Planctomycetota bacterium]|nr:ABC transporter ATP-binding protein [Planctomycetota bacterium]